MDINRIINLLPYLESVSKEQQQKHKKNMKTIELIYQNMINYYLEYIQLISMVVEEVALPNNSISRSKIIENMIYDGYLSKDGSFISTTDKRKLLDFSGYFGIDIMNGYGCCRHKTGIHQDIFHSQSWYQQLLPVISSTQERTVEEIFASNSNHVVCLIEYLGLYYIHDLSYKKFYQFSDMLLLKEYLLNRNEKVNQLLYYRPDCQMILADMTLEEAKRNLQDFLIDSTKSHIHASELKNILEETEIRYQNVKKDLNLISEQTKIYAKKILN